MIVILTQCFPSKVGGIETLVYNIAKFLSKNKKVIVLADTQNISNDKIFDINEKNFQIKRFRGLKFLRKRKKLKELVNIFSLNHIEAVISDSWKSLELPIIFLNKNKIPTISLIHGNEIIIKNEKHKKRIQNILELTNGIVTNSNFTTKLLSEISNKLQNINVIYPGIDLTNKYTEERVNLNKGTPTLLTLARLEKRKGHSLILRSIYNLKNLYPKIQYIIAGEGYELENIKKLIKKYSLEQNVNLVGTINENQKNYIFSKTDIMVMPTSDEIHEKSIEGFGISYIEAAKFGIPSIASNVGGTPEAVLHKNTGLIINEISELDDAIQKLIEDKNFRFELGENAKIRAEKELNWETQINKYNKLITNIQ